MAVEGVRKFFERFMPTRTAKLQEPDVGKVCKPCAVCKATMKAKDEWYAYVLQNQKTACYIYDELILYNVCIFKQTTPKYDFHKGSNSHFELYGFFL